MHHNKQADAVVQIILGVEGEQDKTEQRLLQIQKEWRLIENVILPIPDEEVKNFAIEDIVETNNGFFWNIAGVVAITFMEADCSLSA